MKSVAHKMVLGTLFRRHRMGRTAQTQLLNELGAGFTAETKSRFRISYVSPRNLPPLHRNLCMGSSVSVTSIFWKTRSLGLSVIYGESMGCTSRVSDLDEKRASQLRKRRVKMLVAKQVTIRVEYTC